MSEREWNEWTAQVTAPHLEKYDRMRRRRFIAKTLIICLLVPVIFAALPIWPHTETGPFVAHNGDWVQVKVSVTSSMHHISFWRVFDSSGDFILICNGGCTISCVQMPTNPCYYATFVTYGSLIPALNLTLLEGIAAIAILIVVGVVIGSMVDSLLRIMKDGKEDD